MKHVPKVTTIEKNSLFAYRKGQSLIHSMHPLLKLVLMCVVSIRVFSNRPYGFMNSWLHLGIYASITLVYSFLAKTPLRSYLKLKFVFVLGFCLLLLNLIPPTAEALLDYTLKTSDILYTLMYTSRFFVTTLCALVTFETTSRLELYDAFELIERLIQKIPFAKDLKIASMFFITISFIPEVFVQWNKISLATKARSSSPGLVQYVRILFWEFSALFYNMLHYAEDVRRAFNSKL